MSSAQETRPVIISEEITTTETIVETTIVALQPESEETTTEKRGDSTAEIPQPKETTTRKAGDSAKDVSHPKETTTEKRGDSVGNVSLPERAETFEKSVGFDMLSGPVTVGEALEHVASRIGDKPLTPSDAGAIQSAEAIATGIPSGVKGGPAAAALSAVDSPQAVEVKIGDVLADANAHLPHDKIVTPPDAARVHSAEARNNQGQVQKGGVAASMQHAAAYNQNAGFIPGADGGIEQSFVRAPTDKRT